MIAQYLSFGAWLTLTLVTLALIAAVIVWAIRTGQFAHQDHAGELPLRAHIPDEEEREETSERNGEDAP